MKLSDIKAYVKARLDELSNNDDALLVASDQAVEDLEKEIEAVVVPSVRKIHLDAPNILLRDGVEFTKDYPPYYESTNREEEEDFVVEPQTLIFSPEGGVQNVNVYTTLTWHVDAVSEVKAPARYDNGIYKYVMKLPYDFLRLITLQMSDWDRPIQTLVNEDSAEYRKQKNPYLRGTWKRPMGAIVHRMPYGDFMELYTCKSTAATLRFGQYVPEPQLLPVQNPTHVMICEPLKYPCLNQITAHVLRSIGRVQEAAQYDRMAVQPFYIDPDYARLNPPIGERFNTNQ